MSRQAFDFSVYFVADPAACGGREVEEIVRAAAQGGVTLVQYRDKSGDKERILASARRLKDILEPFAIPLIVNDHADIAREAGADGVHLGQEDMIPEEARRLLGPEAIIGVTAFTAEQIAAIDPDSVDYIGLGPFYPTITDKGKPVLGSENFAELAALSPVPVVGIGGITTENAAAVIRAGADGVAMMRGISEAVDPESAAREFITVIRKERQRLKDLVTEDEILPPACAGRQDDNKKRMS